MIKISGTFSSFSVSDLAEAKSFYLDIIGLKVNEDKRGLTAVLPGGGSLFIYRKKEHKPATYTVLNFEVADIDEAVDELKKQGIKFEIYKEMNQDENGIVRGRESGKGPDIAWFTDPSKNILAVLQK